MPEVSYITIEELYTENVQTPSLNLMYVDV